MRCPLCNLIRDAMAPHNGLSQAQYAAVERVLAQRLQAGDEQARRLRASMAQRADGSVVTLTIGLEVDEHGAVSRCSFVSFTNRQATVDLKHLLHNLRLPRPAWPQMLLSVRIRIDGNVDAELPVVDQEIL